MSSRKLWEKKSSRSSVKSRSRSSSLNKNLRSISEIEENGETIVRGIMHEILENSLETIQKRYMERQTIKFVVHCAHQALTKALKMHFYQHNDYIRSADFWGSEKRIEPSFPDSWAINEIPATKNIAEEEELNTLKRIQSEVNRKGGEILVDSTVDLISEPSESLLEDIRAIIDDIVDNLPVVFEETPEKLEPVTSAFTLVVEGQQSYTDFKMKPQMSRIAAWFPPTVKLPRIDLPESGNSRRHKDSNESLTHETLPPIRTDANYRCLSGAAPEEKAKKTNRN
ncbi:uncharacterized protein LOC103313897 [Tribolium castaneum]|uniref:Uncharacterized protein n=1 Tax=Tribolium castaneum TaxID=7070 RepID=D6WVR6_TRICA|nr:PREDICTED: uncharacterized protein LOC103313897 [Tribolium castaneum]EFA08257.1 hypothetical protein TcasGA2_TC005885 [Tribolium castaneum]|eukprot:XP_008196585.1 PREDICTED: uncharacterized protein LOC103313897 [Tribolium castaneum]